MLSSRSNISTTHSQSQCYCHALVSYSTHLLALSPQSNDQHADSEPESTRCKAIDSVSSLSIESIDKSQFQYESNQSIQCTLNGTDRRCSHREDHRTSANDGRSLPYFLVRKHENIEQENHRRVGQSSDVLQFTRRVRIWLPRARPGTGRTAISRDWPH